MTIDELIARQDEIRSEIQSLDSEFAGRQLPTDSKDKWDRLEDEYKSNAQKLTELEFRRERVAELAGKPENREEATGGLQVPRPGVARGEDIWDLSTARGGSPQEEARTLIDRARRANEQAVYAHPKARKADVQEHVERMIEDLDSEDESDGLGNMAPLSRHMIQTGSPTYRRAFVKAIRRKGLSPVEQRSLNLTGEEGGFLLPFTLDPTIVPTSNGVRNPLRSISNVKQTTTNVWKGVTSGGITAAYREAEAEETGDDSPEFLQPEITCHAADAFAQWTYEFGQDYGSIDTELATMVQKAKDTLEATKLATGSGEAEPFGVLTGAETIIETGTEGKFGVEDVYTFEQALGDTDFGVNARFVGKRAIYNQIRQFAEADGHDLWLRLGDGFARQPDGALGEGLLGYPTYELSTMDSKVESEKIILLFGDFDYYVIADRIGMSAKPIDNVPGENGRPTGQAGLFFFWRNGAKVLSKSAFRKLEVK